MYISDNYKKVKDALEAKRLAEVREAEEHNEELRAKFPEIRKIDAELTRTGLTIFRTALAGEDITPVKERNQALCKKRRELLLSYGYPSDYTEVHYTCPDCHDTGYIDTKMCRCLREALIRENLKSSGIGNLIETQSFDNFDLSHYRESEEDFRRMTQNFEAAKSYAENFPAKRGNLLLIGPTGTGKTHISTAIAKTVISQGFDVLYDSIQNILSAFEYDRFRAGYGQEEPTAKKYLDVTLLVIDDLGTEFTNAFTVSVLYNLLNERANRGLSTVISTNLSVKKLTEIYEDRIYSRMIGSQYQILQFTGKDYRLYH